MTPHLTIALTKDRRDDQAQELVIQAWYVARLMRAERLPELEELLGKPSSGGAKMTGNQRLLRELKAKFSGR